MKEFSLEWTEKNEAVFAVVLPSVLGDQAFSIQPLKNGKDILKGNAMF
jgi:hypothetical protein